MHDGSNNQYQHSYLDESPLTQTSGDAERSPAPEAERGLVVSAEQI